MYTNFPNKNLTGLLQYYNRLWLFNLDASFNDNAISSIYCGFTQTAYFHVLSWSVPSCGKEITKMNVKYVFTVRWKFHQCNTFHY